MSETFPVITLITTVRNGAATIERALQSVAAQTYQNIEYLVLDAASTDGTQAIIERYRPIIHHYRSQTDSGPYDAYRYAFTQISGELVGFVSADDWLAPDAVETVAAMYRESPQARIFGHAMQEHRLKPDGSTAKSRVFRLPEGERFTLRDGLYCQGLTQFYHRDVIDQYGDFAEARYKQMADRDFYICMGLANLPKVTVDKVLYHFLVHPQSNSTSGDVAKTVEMLRETVRMAEDYAARRDVSPAQAALFRDWLCFNSLRLAFFQIKNGEPAKACALLWRVFRRFPLRLLKAAADSKMPEPYRPIAINADAFPH